MRVRGLLQPIYKKTPRMYKGKSNTNMQIQGTNYEVQPTKNQVTSICETYIMTNIYNMLNICLRLQNYIAKLSCKPNRLSHPTKMIQRL